MRLELEDGSAIENPTDSDIASALASLERGDSAFAILGQTEMTYVQAAGGSGGLALEYQQGSLAEHYRSIDQAIPLERVIRAFQKYAKGDNSWRAETQWTRI